MKCYLFFIKLKGKAESRSSTLSGQTGYKVTSLFIEVMCTSLSHPVAFGLCTVNVMWDTNLHLQ